MQQVDVDMENGWKPKAWVAIVLGIFLQPFMFLYVGKVKSFFIALLVIFAIVMSLFLLALDSRNYIDSWGWLVPVSFALLGWHYSRSVLNSVRPWYSKWWGILVSVVLLLVPIALIRGFVFEPFQIPSRAMLPTLAPGNMVLVQKWGYGYYGTYGITFLRTPQNKPILRGNIYVFEYPHANHLDYIKRVVGLPGDHVSISRKNVVVKSNCDNTCSNNLLYSEFVSEWQSIYIDEQQLLKYKETTKANSYEVIINPRAREFKSRFYDQMGTQQGNWIVPEGHLFVMGDNRDNSEDSRYFGFVPIENIKGSVIYVW